jgi:hypothetical protein
MNPININKKNEFVFSDAETAHLRFLSARARAPMKELREALELMGCKNPKFSEATELAEIVGAYELDDLVLKRLRAEGIALEINGAVPYTAPLDFLDHEAFLWSDDSAWKVDEIRNFFMLNCLTPLELLVPQASELGKQVVLHVRGHDLDFWSGVEAIDALEFHRSPWIDIVARRNTP